LLYKKNEQAAFQNLAYLFFGLQYILLPFLLLYLGSFEKFSHLYYAPIPIGILLLHWISDTAAYFSGRTFGRRKIFPRHSPKKSWEGFIAGLLFTMFAGWVFEHFWGIEQFNWISVAFITAVVGLFGDLVESMLKRNLQIKDSGSLLPGHGGLLDRFDGFFLAMPVIFIYYVVLGKFPVG